MVKKKITTTLTLWTSNWVLSLLTSLGETFKIQKVIVHDFYDSFLIIIILGQALQT